MYLWGQDKSPAPVASVLMEWAPPRGAATNGVPSQRPAVARADPTRPSLRHEIPGVGTASGGHFLKGGPEVAVEATDLRRRQGAGRALR